MGDCTFFGPVALSVVRRLDGGFVVPDFSGWGMVDAKMLFEVVFSGLSALVIEGMENAGEVIVARASTRGGAVPVVRDTNP